MDLLERVVVPPRLALISRAGATLAYEPATNRWEEVGDDAAAALRWLRADRPRRPLAAHLERRFGPGPGPPPRTLDQILAWLLLRRLLYLDQVPDLPDPGPVANPLSVVYWICTQACNLRCTYCYQSAAVPHPDELSTAEAFRLVDQVGEAGADTLVFTGGEAFTRSDLLAVAGYAHESGLTTNVITNGHYITPDNIGQVATTFDNVTVSLDHGKPQHHDCNRGEGSWARAVAAIDLLIGAGVPVDVNTVLSHYGLDDIDELLAFVTSRPLGDHRIVPQFPMGRGGGARARRGELSESELLGLSERLAAARRRLGTGEEGATTRISPEGSYGRRAVRRSHCGAGLSEVSVDPRGWVYPCKLLQYPEFRAENVRDRPLGEIYASHPGLAGIRASVAGTLHPCKTCIIRNHCGGGCRGIHYSFTHEYIRAHPLFCAYLRRTFEAEAWMSAGKAPPSRTSGFATAGDDSGEAACGAPAASAFVPLSAVGRPRPPIPR